MYQLRAKFTGDGTILKEITSTITPVKVTACQRPHIDTDM